MYGIPANGKVYEPPIIRNMGLVLIICRAPKQLLEQPKD